ncbi:MAG: tRNA1(Val) (adenine(37)-N6)-methyltransferase [Aminipila sp.]
MNENFLLQGERIDEIGFNSLRLIQKPDEFCYGVDAVILADFAAKFINQNRKLKKGIDLGTGTGIIPFILSHKTELEKIYGVELQKDSFNRACRNAQLNNIENRITFINEDISNLLENNPSLKGSFDVVTTNPPYMSGGAGLVNNNSAKTIARHETTADLDSFIRVSSELLRDKGELFIVHRPSRLVDICEFSRKYKLEPKEMQFVSPNKNIKPNILMLRCVKHGNPELKFMDPLYVYDEEKKDYTDEIMQIYER